MKSITYKIQNIFFSNVLQDRNVTQDSIKVLKGPIRVTGSKELEINNLSNDLYQIKNDSYAKINEEQDKLNAELGKINEIKQELKNYQDSPQTQKDGIKYINDKIFGKPFEKIAKNISELCSLIQQKAIIHTGKYFIVDNTTDIKVFERNKNGSIKTKAFGGGNKYKESGGCISKINVIDKKTGYSTEINKGENKKGLNFINLLSAIFPHSPFFSLQNNKKTLLFINAKDLDKNISLTITRWSRTLKGNIEDKYDIDSISNILKKIVKKEPKALDLKEEEKQKFIEEHETVCNTATLLFVSLNNQMKIEREVSLEEIVQQGLGELNDNIVGGQEKQESVKSITRKAKKELAKVEKQDREKQGRIRLSDYSNLDSNIKSVTLCQIERIMNLINRMKRYNSNQGFKSSIPRLRNMRIFWIMFCLIYIR